MKNNLSSNKLCTFPMMQSSLQEYHPVCVELYKNLVQVIKLV